MRWRSQIWLGLRLVLFGGACILLFRGLDTSVLLHHLYRIPLQYLVLAFGLQLLMRALMAMQLQWLLRVRSVSIHLYTLFTISLITVFYGLVLPGEVASSGIGWHKLRRAGSEGATALAVIVVARLVNLIVLVVVGTIFWLGDGRMQEYQIGVFLLLMLVGICASYWLLTVESQRLSRFPLPQWLQTSRRRFVKVLTELQGLPVSSKITIFLLSAALHLVGIASHVVFAQAVGLTLSIWTIGWIRSVALTLGLLPLSLAGFGIREASFITLLYSYGATMEQAFTYSILVVLVTLGTGLLGAGHEILGIWQDLWVGKKHGHAHLAGSPDKYMRTTTEPCSQRSDDSPNLSKIQ